MTVLVQKKVNKMTALKVRRIGNSLGVILPKEMLTKHRIREGDDLFAGVDDDGLNLSPFDPKFEKVMEAADRVTRRFKNTLKELAR